MLVLALIAVLVGPAVGSYRSSAQLRSTAVQFAEDAYAARRMAIAQNTPIVLQIPAGVIAPRGGWGVRRFGGAQPLWQTSVPPTLHVTSHCPQTIFSPTGTASNAACPSSPATVVCFDNRGGAHTVNIQASIVRATARLTLVEGKGPCT